MPHNGLKASRAPPFGFSSYPSCPSVTAAWDPRPKIRGRCGLGGVTEENADDGCKLSQERPFNRAEITKKCKRDMLKFLRLLFVSILFRPQKF